MRWPQFAFKSFILFNIVSISHLLPTYKFSTIILRHQTKKKDTNLPPRWKYKFSSDTWQSYNDASQLPVTHILRGHKHSDASNIEQWQLIYGGSFALGLQSSHEVIPEAAGGWTSSIHPSIHCGCQDKVIFNAAEFQTFYYTLIVRTGDSLPQPTWLSESTKIFYCWKYTPLR